MVAWGMHKGKALVIQATAKQPPFQRLDLKLTVHSAPLIFLTCETDLK